MVSYIITYVYIYVLLNTLSFQRGSMQLVN